MKKTFLFSHVQLLFFLFVSIASCAGQEKTGQSKDSKSQAESNVSDADPYFAETKTISTSYGPSSITRNILQDRKGNIWLATWEGIIRYDAVPSGRQGKTFTNYTNKEGLRRFHVFTILEDSKGIIWFGTIGAGVYRYDPSAGQAAFTNITTEDGLAHNSLGCIYEDKKGNIWFGTQGGASRYDGNSFSNFTTKDGLCNNDINAIIEDKNGKLWIGTRGDACIYDGTIFTKITNKEGRGFENVRSIIEDKKGNIWLGGNDGLWRYDGQEKFTNFTKDFVGYIYEDKKGNIWTSSAKNGNAGYWVLSRYNAMPLPYNKISATQILFQENMFFGILEDRDGGIWFGTLNGVCRYDPRLPDGQENAFNWFKKPALSDLLPYEPNPYKQQYNNMLGKWTAIISDNKKFKTLELLEAGNYLLIADGNEESGKWNIADAQHISLGDAEYRFFFKKENLVLIDGKSNEYEFAK